ncbi:hypothetical protein [Veillonella sp.]|nr:hypothetical protein [Veillonella sp.]
MAICWRIDADILACATGIGKSISSPSSPNPRSRGTLYRTVVSMV